MKSINVNELQSKISKIIKAVEKGEEYQVMRYSKPAVVVLSQKKYDSIMKELVELKGSCRICLDEFKKTKKISKL